MATHASFCIVASHGKEAECRKRTGGRPTSAYTKRRCSCDEVDAKLKTKEFSVSACAAAISSSVGAVWRAACACRGGECWFGLVYVAGLATERVLAFGCKEYDMREPLPYVIDQAAVMKLITVDSPPAAVGFLKD